MILSVTLNPSVDRSLFLEKFEVGDTNRVLRTETDAGGKGVNVARVIVELGAEALATGFVGGGTGSFVKHVLDEEDVPCDFIEIAGETRMNFSIEDKSDNPPTTLNEPGPNISADERTRLFEKLRAFIPRCSYVAMGGSLPVGVEQDAFVQILNLADGKPCVVDADGEPMKLALKAKPFMVKPNAHEAERLLDMKVAGQKDALKAAERLHSLGISVAIVSLGEDGAAAVTGQGRYVADSPKVKAVSTIGSGDSLIGGFLYGLENAMSHEDCLRWGVAAGAATAMTDGAGICKRPQVLELLEKVVIHKS